MTASTPLSYAIRLPALMRVQLPEGAGRLAVFIDGTEGEEDIAALKDMGAVLALLKIAPGVSRVHASRRVFEQLQQQQVRSRVCCKGSAAVVLLVCVVSAVLSPQPVHLQPSVAAS